MAENSGIPWTDHTFNPWWGCHKVSSGCQNCYAESLSARWGHEFWGKDAPRREMAEKYWREPMKWDRWCGKHGVRRKVFVGSMCDVMEPRVDLSEWRSRLWDLIEATPNLDWLLLTKRPEEYRRLLPLDWIGDGCPQNVWVGCTVEDQRNYDARVEHLARVPAVVRFLSMEPLLGPVSLGLLGAAPGSWGYGYREVGEIINWVIVGAESGHSRRPFERDWARRIRAECVSAGVPFFYKQEISSGGRKIETPPLDGRLWTQSPSDDGFACDGYM